MRFVVLFVMFFIASSLAVINTHGQSPLEKLGLSKTKPAEGPMVEVEDGFMVPYTLTVPGSSVEIEMIPVPGGTFVMGSSEDEDGREEHEGPQIKITVAPMWVAKTETTWRQYKIYMSMYRLFKDLESRGVRKVSDSNKVDAVTAPTELYDTSFTFYFGNEPDLPAVTMTQYAAKQYTKWLSKLTGHQYRLPSEAEWEYACRAGTTTAFHFGDDDSQIDEFAWYYENAEDLPHPVGQKKPNAFGLHDMHGNVMELVIDNFSEDGYVALEGKPQPIKAVDAILWPASYESRAVRGGSFQDDAELLRSAARLGTEDVDWKEDDPNVPLSPWWFTTDPARGVGFRIFRSYKPLDKEIIEKFWEIQDEDVALDVEMRLNEGRGILSPVDPSLAEDIKSLDG